MRYNLASSNAEWVASLMWSDNARMCVTTGDASYFAAYDIAKLWAMQISRRVSVTFRNLPVGAGEAVMLKNQRRHNTVTSEDSGTLMVAVNS